MSMFYKMPKFDYRGFKSTMDNETRKEIVKQADACFRNNDDEGRQKWLAKLPLHPLGALGLLYDPFLGRKFLEEEDFNLADAEAFYGPDWLDKYDPKVNSRYEKRSKQLLGY